jgi:hypothetical protein
MVTARSAWGVAVSLSVKVLLVRSESVVPAGGLTVKVRGSGPVALGSIR